MDMKKHWEKYNVKVIKTIKKLKSSSDRIYIPCSIFGVIFASSFGGVFITISFRKFYNIFGLIVSIITVHMQGHIFGAIHRIIKNICLKYDTNPKFSDSKKKSKKILTKMCEAGNFRGFEKLYPELPPPMQCLGMTK